MADFAKTISNSINLFASPADKWGDWNWNAFLWGAGTADLQVSVTKVLSESLSFTDALYDKSIGHLIAESLSPVSDMSSEVLEDGEGYSYVFTSPATNAENRSNVSYASGSAAGTSWASSTAGSTTWE
jgi:hypothetical protein